MSLGRAVCSPWQPWNLRVFREIHLILFILQFALVEKVCRIWFSTHSTQKVCWVLQFLTFWVQFRINCANQSLVSFWVHLSDSKSVNIHKTTILQAVFVSPDNLRVLGVSKILILIFISNFCWLRKCAGFDSEITVPKTVGFTVSYLLSSIQDQLCKCVIGFMHVLDSSFAKFIKPQFFMWLAHLTT